MGVHVFTDLVRTHYASSRLSLAYLFSIFITALGLLVPFFLGYTSHAFWLQTNTSYQAPSVQYTHQVLVFAQGNEGTQPLEIFWSTLPSQIHSRIQQHLHPATIRSREEDTNEDQVPDTFHLHVQLPLTSDQTIQKLTALVFFDYTLQRRTRLNMDAIAYISQDTVFPASKLIVDGDMDLIVKEPLSVKRLNLPDQTKVLDQLNISRASDLSLEKMIAAYKARTVTANYINPYPIWYRDTGAPSTKSSSRSFELEMVIRFPKVHVLYRPELFEVLKMAWIQYYALWVIVMYFLDKICRFVYQNKILDSITIVEPVAPYKDPTLKMS